MDGENNGKPYEQMDDLGVQYHYFWKHPYIFTNQNPPHLMSHPRRPTPPKRHGATVV